MTDRREKNARPPAQAAARPGTVYLVGAGPGDAGLITARGLDLLRTAEVIVYDALANPDLLDEAADDAERIDAGKRAKRHKLTQEQTNALLADRAAAGRSVVRLKGGDPYVFGRGSEEAMYLHDRGVAVEVVPGIPAAIAAPAYAGIPVTHRNVATSCTFVTGHEDPTKPDRQVDFAPLAALIRKGGTVCLYMAMGRLPSIAQTLIDHGCPAATPAAAVQWGATPRQRTVRATLGDLPDAVEREGLGAPAITIVGPVVNVAPEALNWFERRPLFGQTIVVTRTRQQASALRARLEALGAAVIEAPTIAIDPTPDFAAVDRAVADLPDRDWLVLTSANGVAALAEALRRNGRDARHLAGVNIAAVGRATAEAARRTLAVEPDFLPSRSMGEALAEEMIEAHPLEGRRCLLFRADIGRPTLRDKLVEAGAAVDDVAAYQTRPADALPERLLDALRDGAVDWITFTSGSTARNFAALLPDPALLDGVKLASIGPTASDALRDAGLRVDLEADPHDIDGLVQTLVGRAGPSPSGDEALR